MPDEPDLSRSLEDYLETIYALASEKGVVRVKDIAAERGVKAGSVSPAMARLAAMGLVRRELREHIALSPSGERLARRVFARHQLLRRLLGEVLQVAPAEVEEVACAMEHSLTSSATERLLRLFEFLETQPQGQAFLREFHRWMGQQDQEARVEEDGEVWP